MGWTLAIDFGTTASSVAVSDGDEIELVEVAGQVRVPSAVFCTEQGELIAGPQALQLGAARPDLLERNPKRRMGDRSVMLGEHRFTPAQLAASVLRLLVSSARAHRGGTEPTQVRITHPASWAATRLGVLTEAAELAGLPAPVLMPEPVAAALHYADTRVGPGDLVAVYDLGGGTFDTAVLRRDPDGFALVGPTGGSDRLGGEDFDQRLYHFVGDAIAAQDPGAWEQLRYGETRPWVRANSALRQEIQRAKEGLSSAADYTIYVSAPVDQELRVTREDLERLISSDIARTVDEMVATVQRSDLQIADVAAVYLVGGSSRIPLVTRLLAERFGSVPVTWGDPQAAVVLGAAKAGGSAKTGGSTTVGGSAKTGGSTAVGGSAKAGGSTAVDGSAMAGGSAPAGDLGAARSARPDERAEGGLSSRPAPKAPAVAVDRTADADPVAETPPAQHPADVEDPGPGPRSRRRRLLPVVLVAAVVVALVTTVGLIIGLGKRSPAATAVTLTGIVDGDAAMPGARSYAIDGATLSSTVEMRNPGADPIRRIWIEVVPKSVAEEVSQVHFTRDPAGVLATDPVVYFVIELAPGATDTVGWSVPLPATATADHAYLRALSEERRQESATARTTLAEQIDRIAAETGIPVVTATAAPGSPGSTGVGGTGSELAGGPPPVTPVGSQTTSTTTVTSPAGDALSGGATSSAVSSTTGSSTGQTSGTTSPAVPTTPTTLPRPTTLPAPTTPRTTPRTTAAPATTKTTPKTTAPAPTTPRTTVPTTPTTPKTTVPTTSKTTTATTTKSTPPPTLSFTSFPGSVTLDEQAGWSAPVAAKSSNGAAVAISVSGLPSGLSYGGGKVSGTVSHGAATVTTDRRNGIKSRSFTVTVTATATGASAISRSFTVTVRDTHRLMPSYIGYYGCTGNSPCTDPASLPNVAAVSTPSFACQVGGGSVDTIVRQSVPAGSVMAWGQAVLFTYASSACG